MKGSEGGKSSLKTPSKAELMGRLDTLIDKGQRRLNVEAATLDNLTDLESRVHRTTDRLLQMAREVSSFSPLGWANVAKTSQNENYFIWLYLYDG